MPIRSAVAAALALLVTFPCLAGRLDTMSRYDRLRTARVAPGPMPLTAEFLERQRAEGFNAVALTDVEKWDPARQRWKRYDLASIARQLALARTYDMSVFVCIAAVEPHPVEGVVRDPSFVVRGLSAFGTDNGRRTADDAPSGHRLEYLPDAELSNRIQLWSTQDRGEIIGAYFLGDDGFFMRVPAERQRGWRAMARGLAPELPVMGMIGEFGLTATPQEREELFDPAAFDHLLWLNYPYNLGRAWGRPLDHLATSTPDVALADYEHDYAAAMHEFFFRRLAPGQLIVPVIQTFYYEGDVLGAVPRARDVELQSRLVHYELHATMGQRDNYAMGYFYAGASDADDPFPVPKGIDDVPAWAAAVARQNRSLERAARLGLRPRHPLRPMTFGASLAPSF